MNIEFIDKMFKNERFVKALKLLGWCFIIVSIIIQVF